MSYGTLASRALRDGIRSGTRDCPDDGRWCNRVMAEHVDRCPWEFAMNRIYALEREMEMAKVGGNDGD